MRLIALLPALLGLALGAHGVPAQDYTGPPGPCEVIAAKDLDGAQMVFSFVARETAHTQYDANWVDWQKTTRFVGTVDLAHVVDRGGCDPEDFVDQTASDPADPVPPPPPPAGPEPFDQSRFMMERMAACESAADPTRMMECMADAVDESQQLADTCANPVPGADLPEICGAAPPPPATPVVTPPQPGRDIEDLPEVEMIIEGQPGFAEPPFSEWDAKPEILRAIGCTGTTTVTGSGSGYDQSYLRQPNYSFSIAGNWTAPRKPGGSDGCSAGIIINPISGMVRIVLQPGPRNIRIERQFNNFRGLEEQPEVTFEGLTGRTDLPIYTFIDEDMSAFKGRETLKPIIEQTQYTDRLVETEVRFSFVSP